MKQRHTPNAIRLDPRVKVPTYRDVQLYNAEPHYLQAIPYKKTRIRNRYAKITEPTTPSRCEFTLVFISNDGPLCAASRPVRQPQEVSRASFLWQINIPHLLDRYQISFHYFRLTFSSRGNI